MTNPDPLAGIDPVRRAAITDLLGTDPDPVAELRRQVHELQCRLEDLTGVVADLQRRVGPEDGDRIWIA